MLALGSRPGGLEDPDDVPTRGGTRRSGTACTSASANGWHGARCASPTGLLDRFASLRSPVPMEHVPLRDDGVIDGVPQLPITWDTT